MKKELKYVNAWAKLFDYTQAKNSKGGWSEWGWGYRQACKDIYDYLKGEVKK